MCDDADVAEKTSYGPPYLYCVELLRNLSNRFFADKSYPQQKTAGNSGGFYQFLSLLERRVPDLAHKTRSNTLK